MFCNDRFTRNTKKQSGIATSIIESFLITLYQFRTFPGAILCPFSPLSSSQRGHTLIRPVYISSVTKAICCNFPSRNTPSSYYQKSDLFFLSLVFFFLSPWCDLNIDNPSWNKYTHLHVFFFSFTPAILYIHAGMEDNPPERNIKGLGTQPQDCACGKQSRRNSSLTCCCSTSVDWQQNLFLCDFTLSFPHFSSTPTFSTLFLRLPLSVLLPFHNPPHHLWLFSVIYLFSLPLFFSCFLFRFFFFSRHVCFPSLFSLLCI